MSFSNAAVVSFFDDFRFHVGLCHSVCVFEGRGCFVWVWVWVCDLARARLCASLCVNDSSVTMYFGESDPHFMVQRCNSVCRLSIHCCDDVFKLYPMSKFV